MEALLGKKMGMTQVFTDKGDCVPVTVIQVEKCVPVLKRTPETDGYQAVLVAYGERKKKHANKAQLGFYAKHKMDPAQTLTEFRDQDIEDDALGKPLKVDLFSEGDFVNVIGTSKGKGFQGVMKRHGFAGHPASRGNHESFRGPGSIGMATFPGRVLRGHPMAGHMGNERVFVKNLSVVSVDPGNNTILIRGAVPGKNGGLVRVVKSQKQPKNGKK
ncbi:MAG: 50S ribosomal protein L3 [Candidatus Nitronauta litoralis]|uniref:Large ribosomal subunit protein uL3 n=1 Tax=Candidatus Nitronauta litoralis TaxID=2705533 RepID=A0A7T0BVJ4_9BACT|nr:MAG: 50S ribosomal protein L3 [Candidatus Nitronauta litoralis]